MKNHQKQSAAIIAFFCFFSMIIPLVAFAEESTGDIATMRKEIDALRKECQQSKELNSKLETRLEQLEQKMNSLQSQPARITPVASTEQRIASKEEKRGVVTSLTHDDLARLTKGFEFGGYFRSGAGGNSRGGKMEAFQAPDAPAKYRLGNEQETYLEAIFSEKDWNPDPDGVKIYTQMRFSYKTQQNQSEDTGISNTVPPSSISAVKADKVLLRELYAQMGNFIPNDPEAKVWAGERFYRLPELDINDFWWSDMSGYGGGFEDLKFFDIGRLNIAYIGFASNDLDLKTNHGRFYKNNLHFMLKEVKVPAGKGTFWINGGYMAGGSYAGTKYPNLGGVDLGLMHSAGKEKVNNQFSMQFGYGVNSTLSSSANIAPSHNDKNAWTFRTTDMLNYKFNEKVSVQLVDVFQYADSGRSTQAKTLWASVGMRPVVGLSKYLALEIEPGVDYVNEPLKGYADYLFKFTTALRLAPGGQFDAHPRFRLFATYAKWGSDFKDQGVGGSGYNGQSYGTNIGIQCEHWW